MKVHIGVALKSFSCCDLQVQRAHPADYICHPYSAYWPLLTPYEYSPLGSSAHGGRYNATT